MVGKKEKVNITQHVPTLYTFSIMVQEFFWKQRSSLMYKGLKRVVSMKGIVLKPHRFPVCLPPQPHLWTLNSCFFLIFLIFIFAAEKESYILSCLISLPLQKTHTQKTKQNKTWGVGRTRNSPKLYPWWKQTHIFIWITKPLVSSHWSGLTDPDKGGFKKKSQGTLLPY